MSAPADSVGVGGEYEFKKAQPPERELRYDILYCCQAAMASNRLVK